MTPCYREHLSMRLPYSALLKVPVTTSKICPRAARTVVGAPTAPLIMVYCVQDDGTGESD